MVQIMALVKRVQTENSDGRNKIKVKKVLINDPATIVFWQDGTKTVLMRNEEDEYDAERVIEKAIAIKLSGTSKTKFNKYVKSIVEEHFDGKNKVENKAHSKKHVIEVIEGMINNNYTVFFETYEELHKVLEIIEENFKFITWCDSEKSKPTEIRKAEYKNTYNDCKYLKYSIVHNGIALEENSLGRFVMIAKDLIEAYYG